LLTDRFGVGKEVGRPSQNDGRGEVSRHVAVVFHRFPEVVDGQGAYLGGDAHVVGDDDVAGLGVQDGLYQGGAGVLGQLAEVGLLAPEGVGFGVEVNRAVVPTVVSPAEAVV